MDEAVEEPRGRDDSSSGESTSKTSTSWRRRLSDLTRKSKRRLSINLDTQRTTPPTTSQSDTEQEPRKKEEVKERKRKEKKEKEKKKKKKKDKSGSDSVHSSPVKKKKSKKEKDEKEKEKETKKKTTTKRRVTLEGTELLAKANKSSSPTKTKKKKSKSGSEIKRGTKEEDKKGKEKKQRSSLAHSEIIKRKKDNVQEVKEREEEREKNEEEGKGNERDEEKEKEREKEHEREKEKEKEREKEGIATSEPPKNRRRNMKPDKMQRERNRENKKRKENEEDKMLTIRNRKKKRMQIDPQQFARQKTKQTRRRDKGPKLVHPQEDERKIQPASFVKDKDIRTLLFKGDRNRYLWKQIAAKKDDGVHACALLEELCSALSGGTVQLLPQIKIVGMEGSGKSALFEAMMGGFPFGFTGPDRATVAPISYSFRRDTELAKLRWRIRVQYNGAEADRVDESQEGLESIRFLHDTLEKIMTTIKRRKGFSFTPIEVTIDCADPSILPINIVDFPGVMRDRAQRVRIGHAVRGIMEKNLRHLNSCIVILVERADVDTRSLKYREIARLLNSEDPLCRHTMAVLTHADVAMENGMLSTLKKIKQKFISWNILDNQLEKDRERGDPYILPLHNLTMDQIRRKEDRHCKKKQIIANSDLVTENLLAREIYRKHEEMSIQLKRIQAKAGKTLPNRILSKIGIINLRKAIETKVTTAFCRNVDTLLLQTLLRYENDLKRNLRRKEFILKQLRLENISQHTLSQFAEAFVDNLENLMSGGGGSSHPEFKKWNLADEYASFTGDSYWPDEYCGGLSRNSEYLQYVENSSELLSHGGWRLDRMKADIRVRIRSIEADSPDRLRLMNLANRFVRTGGMDLNSAAMRLASQEAERKFGAGVDYITNRTIDILSSLLDQSRKMVQHNTHNTTHATLLPTVGLSFASKWLMEGNMNFDREVSRVLDGWMLGRVRERLENQIRRRGQDMWKVTRINQPIEFGNMALFLSPAKETENIVESIKNQHANRKEEKKKKKKKKQREEQTIKNTANLDDYFIDAEGCLRCVNKEGEDEELWPRPLKLIGREWKQLVFTREERMIYSGRWCKGGSNTMSYQMAEPRRGREPTDEEIKKAVHAFHAQFAVLRERFVMLVDETIEGCIVSQLQRERADMRRELLKRLQARAMNKKATEEELQRMYGFDVKIKRLEWGVAKEKKHVDKVHQKVEDIRHILASLRREDARVRICPYGERNAVNTPIRHT